VVLVYLAQGQTWGTTNGNMLYKVMICVSLLYIIGISYLSDYAALSFRWPRSLSGTNIFSRFWQSYVVYVDVFLYVYELCIWNANPLWRSCFYSINRLNPTVFFFKQKWIEHQYDNYNIPNILVCLYEYYLLTVH